MDNNSNTNKRNKTICFTGGRPHKLCGYDANKYKDFTEILAAVIADAYKNGYTRFISGGAQGFDQTAFKAVELAREKYKCDVENILYLPFPSYGSHWPENGLFSQNDLNDIKDKASFVCSVSDDPENSKSATPMLMARNHAMVDAADFVLALSPMHHRLSGGTAECVAYAVKRKKDIGYIDYDVTVYGMRIRRCIKAYDKGVRVYD